MKNLLFIAFIFLFSILSTSNLIAADLYVDQRSTHGQCDDNYTAEENDISHPWCSLAKANAAHSSGDTVYILPGTYRETLDPKSGIDADHHTAYKGYSGNRADVQVLGSEHITGWQPLNGGPIYYATVDDPGERQECYEPDDYPDYFGPCVPDTDHCYILKAKTMDCWDSSDRWFMRADLDGSHFRASLGLDELDTPGEFYYDYPTRRLYLRAYDNGNPESQGIECSRRNLAHLDSSFITFEALTIKHSMRDGIRMTYDMHDVDIINNDISFNSGSGSCAENPDAIMHETNGYDPYALGINIIGNRVHDQGSDKGPAIYNGSHTGGGIKLYSAFDSVVANNEVYNVDIGIFMKDGDTNITVKNNIVHNIQRGISFGQPYDDMRSAFAGEITGNLIYNASEFGIDTVYNGNIISIRNNTVFNTRGIAIAWGNLRNYREGTLVDISNNIISTISTTSENRGYLEFYWDSANVASSDNNLFFDKRSHFGYTDPDCYYDDCGWPVAGPYYPGTFYDTLESWRTGTGFDLNSKEENPMFVDTSNGDFHLMEGSPAIDAGILDLSYHCPVSDDDNPAQTNCRHWRGAAPDIGAFEFEQSGPDTTPPVRSNGQPTETLSADTTQTSISLSTNESATCRYSTTPAQEYSSMADTFSSTGGTTHSTMISGLHNGQSYSYYVKCIDQAEPPNANTDVFTISFSIALPDYDAPKISNIEPSGSLPSGTEEVEIRLNTDEHATCRLVSEAGLEYDSGRDFDDTNGLYHSTQVAGLRDGQSYTYYVFCMDLSDNINSEGYMVAFSIGSSSSAINNEEQIVEYEGSKYNVLGGCGNVSSHGNDISIMGSLMFILITLLTFLVREKK